MKNLGKRLQDCREAQKITQAEMAEACGLSKNYISAIERGINKCSAYTLVAYADKLNMSLDELVGRDYAHQILPELRSILSKCNDEQQTKILRMIQLMLSD